MPSDETHDTNVHRADPVVGADHHPSSKRPVKVIAWVFRFLIAIGLILGAGVIAIVLFSTRVQPAQIPEEIARLNVRVMEARPVSVSRTWDGYGTARSMNAADLVAQVPGRIIERPDRIESGVRVNEGDLILKLDTTDYENALSSAEQAAAALEAQLDGLIVESDRIGTQLGYARDEIGAAQRDLERIEQAMDAGAANEAQRDSALLALRRTQREAEMLQQQLDVLPSRRAALEAQLAGQRAAATTARANVERSEIRAPFDGDLQRVSGRVGDWLGVGTVAARIVDSSRLEIPISLPATSASWVRSGHRVDLWTDAPNGVPEKEGQITRVAPEADSMSRTITVFVEVRQDPRAEDRLNSGRFVMGRVRTPDADRRFVVPRRAIQSGRLLIAHPSDDGTYTVLAREIDIAYSFEGAIDSLDPDEDQWTVIREGLEQGDLVIVSLLDQLREGMAVGLVDDDVSPTETNEQGAP